MDYKIDEAWKADEDGKRRIYEGMVSIEKNDPNTGRRKSLKVFSGRFSMEEGPHRLREVSEQEQLPVHGNTPSVPEEDGSYSLESPLKEDQGGGLLCIFRVSQELQRMVDKSSSQGVYTGEFAFRRGIGP